MFGALRREGRLDLHAACVTPPRRGRSVLIPGISGAGKTTLAMALHLAGWNLLTDDHVLIWQDEDAGGLIAASLRRPVFATAETLGRLGGAVEARHEVRGLGKRLIEVESDTRDLVGRPAAIVFPERSSAPTRVESIRPAEAFGRLLRAAPYLAAETEAKPCIEVARRLAALPCFLLHAGEDLFDSAVAERVVLKALDERVPSRDGED